MTVVPPARPPPALANPSSRKRKNNAPIAIVSRRCCSCTSAHTTAHLLVNDQPPVRRGYVEREAINGQYFSLDKPSSVSIEWVGLFAVVRAGCRHGLAQTRTQTISDAENGPWPADTPWSWFRLQY